MRQIQFTIKPDRISPASVQRAGIQGEHNATSLSFEVDSGYWSSIVSDADGIGNLRWRIDYFDSSGGTVQSESKVPENNTMVVLLGENMTRNGGTAKVFVSLCCVKDDAEFEVFSYPAYLSFESKRDGSNQNGEPRASLTTLEDSAKQSATRAENAATRSETAAESADVSAALAESSAERAENLIEHIYTDSLEFESGTIWNGNEGSDLTRLRQKGTFFVPVGTKINHTTLGTGFNYPPICVHIYKSKNYSSSTWIKSSGWVSEYTIKSSDIQDGATGCYVRILLRKNDGTPLYVNDEITEDGYALIHSLKIAIPANSLYQDISAVSEIPILTEKVSSLENKTDIIDEKTKNLNSTLYIDRMEWETGSIANGYNDNSQGSNTRIRTDFIWLPTGTTVTTATLPSEYSDTPIIIWEYSQKTLGPDELITSSGWTNSYTTIGMSGERGSYVRVLARKNDSEILGENGAINEKGLFLINALRQSVGIDDVFIETNRLQGEINDIEEDIGEMQDEINTIQNGLVPTYYKDKIEDTKGKIRNLPAENFNYIAITDIHYPTDGGFTKKRLQQMMATVQDIADNCNIDAVVVLGDLIEGGSAATKETSVSNIQDVVNCFVKIKKPVLFSYGNHDNNAYNFSSSDMVSHYITINEWKNMCAAPFGNPGDVYYKDFKDKKIRLIMANTCDYDETVSDGTVSISNYSSIMVRPEQLDSIADMLLNTPYDVVLCTHALNTNLLSLVKTFNENGEWTDSQNNTIDFSSTGGRQVLLYHCGHYHNTAMENCSTYSVNIVSTDTGSLSSIQQNAVITDNLLSTWVNNAGTRVNDTRTSGTVSEACFDIISIGSDQISKIRFGAGLDEEITDLTRVPVEDYELVKSIDNSSTNMQIPTAKAVYDLSATKKNIATVVTSGTNITLADNTEYVLTDVTGLTLLFPQGDFECWLSITTASVGTIDISIPQTRYIGEKPTFANGETWEMSVKNGVIVASKVGAAQ